MQLIKVEYLKYKTPFNINKLTKKIEDKQIISTLKDTYNLIFYYWPIIAFRYKDRVYVVKNKLRLVDDEQIGIEIDNNGDIYFYERVE